MGKKLITLMLCGLFALTGLLPINATAATNTGQGLEISPPLLDLKADPGQVLKTQVRVRNVTNESLVVRAGFEDFIANGEDGQPKILLDANEKSPYSLKDWLGTTPSLTLAAGERQTLDLTLTVPNDASPGGHYGVVRFTGTPPELEDTGVSLSASVGTLLLVNVSGDVSESAKVAELYTGKGGKRGWLFEYGPIGITTRLQNTGNTHFQPKGTVQVRNMFGKDVEVSQFNQTTRNVLPGSVRKFEQTLDKKLLFGRYTVQADIVYGADNKIASKTISFWVIPYKLIILAIAAIALLVFGPRRYNRYIISRSQKKPNATTAKKTKPAKKGKK